MSNGIRSLPRYQEGGVASPDSEEAKRRRLWQLMAGQRDAPPVGEERGGIASLIQGAIRKHPLAGISRLASAVVGRRSDTGYVPGVSEAIYNTIEPVGYDKNRSQFADVLWRIARGDPGQEPFHRDELEGKNPSQGDIGPFNGFGERRMPISPGREDAFRTYLGLPQEYDTFKEAEYRPTRGSGENIRTLDFADQSHPSLGGILGDREQRERASQRMALELEWRESAPRRNELHNRITSLYRLENPSIHDTEELSRLKGEVGALEGVLDTPIKEYPDYLSLRDIVETLNDPTNWDTPEGGMLYRGWGHSAARRNYVDKFGLKGPHPSYSQIHGLQGTYTVSKGEDERGPYVSYYDKWDLAPKIAKYSRAGQPFDIYGRMYYDPDTYEYLPNE